MQIPYSDPLFLALVMHVDLLMIALFRMPDLITKVLSRVLSDR